jgi:hypothetical protein
MRGGIGVKAAVKDADTALQAGTSSGPDSAQQTKAILFSPWKDIAEGKDCSFTNSCNRRVITTPMSVVDKAYSNVPKGCRTLETLEKCKSLTPSQRQGDENKLLADTEKLDDFLKTQPISEERNRYLKK